MTALQFVDAPERAPATRETKAALRAQRRRCWLAIVERLTRHYREAKAKLLDDKAAAAAARGDESGRRYHAARANGQRTKFERVADCSTGLGTIKVTCKGCGCVHDYSARCASHLLCVACRMLKGKRARKRFLIARAVAVENALRKGLMHKQRRGGAYSEKLLTLTVPHDRLDTRERIELMQRAWPLFLRAFNRELCELGAKQDSVIYAVHEWAPAKSDECGHPHRHVWLLCPWLERERLVELWHRAIANAGYRWEPGERVVLDIRRTKPGQEAKELIKYLTKDLVAGGGYVDPETFAVVYQMYDGKRRMQGSRGFMSCVLRAPCSDCSEEHGYEVEFVRPVAATDNVVPLGRAPP